MIGALAPEQGNRWHAVRYRWRGGSSAWSQPFWSDRTSALGLTPLGSELWSWLSGAWSRVF